MDYNMFLTDIKFMPFDLVSSETTDPVVLSVVVSPLNTLRSETNSFLQIRAREHNSSDPYVDLANGLDLSSYSEGQIVDFDFIAVAQEVTGLKKGVLSIVVTKPISPANWLL